MESTPQVLQAQFLYAGLDVYRLNNSDEQGYFIAFIKAHDKRFGKIDENNRFVFTEDTKRYGERDEYIESLEYIIVYLVPATSVSEAREKIKARIDEIDKGRRGTIFVNPRNNPAFPSKYYNAHLYASGSRGPFFPGDVPVAPPAL